MNYIKYSFVPNIFTFDYKIFKDLIYSVCIYISIEDVNVVEKPNFSAKKYTYD